VNGLLQPIEDEVSAVGPVRQPVTIQREHTVIPPLCVWLIAVDVDQVCMSGMVLPKQRKSISRKKEDQSACSRRYAYKDSVSSRSRLLYIKFSFATSSVSITIRHDRLQRGDQLA
jgi:hypothetical protein